MRQIFDSILKFSHLLIRELIEGLNPNEAIFSVFSIEIYYHIVHNGSILRNKTLESILRFSYLLISRLIKGLSPNWAMFSTFTTYTYHNIIRANF